MNENLGKTFRWGVATSSHQIEGGNRNNDWWDWEAKGVVDGGARSGAATDHRRFFREDIARVKELGLDSYRFSFEWSRLEPEAGRFSSEDFHWYRQLIEECERHDIVPMATLHHFTSPLWFAKMGGFSNQESPEIFLRFCKKVGEEFGARIPLWCTLNEPMVLVAGTYLGRFMPPGKVDVQKAGLACANLLKAHVLAYDHLKTTYRTREGHFREVEFAVGFAHNMIDFLPDRRFHPGENLAAFFVSALYNDAWLDAVSGRQQKFAMPGVLQRAPQVEIARGRKTYDFIGVNYYTKAYVQWRPRAPSKESAPQIPLGLAFARRKEKASDLQWALHPQGFAHMLDKVAAYNSPIYITENGIADAGDQLRREYIFTHLREVARAVGRGVDIRGYYHWSLIDNFEWIKGFWPRFGLYAVDYETFERRARPSAAYYRDIVCAHPAIAPSMESLRDFRPMP